MDHIELFNHLLRIIILSHLKPYSYMKIICIRWEYLLPHDYEKKKKLIRNNYTKNLNMNEIPLQWDMKYPRQVDMPLRSIDLILCKINIFF